MRPISIALIAAVPLVAGGCTWNHTSSADEAPTAEITECADAPANAPGAAAHFEAAAATVRIRNPGKSAVRAHVLVDFGQLGLGDANDIHVEGKDEVEVKVAPPLAPRVGGFDCELKEATFSSP